MTPDPVLSSDFLALSVNGWHHSYVSYTFIGGIWMLLMKSIFAVLLVAPMFGSDAVLSKPVNLKVHEWGTFTSVAGDSGAPQPWTSLAAPSDLPCFVYHLGNQCIKCALPSAPPTTVTTAMATTVRMETPVLYFYAPQKMALSVRVDFPQGWITEWYPQTSRVRPEISIGADLPLLGGGHIEWNQIVLDPEMRPAFQAGQGASPYYAARSTDSTPIRVGGQSEKFIFYRGIANFPVPLWAKISGQHSIELNNKGDHTIPLAIVFENRGGRLGYRFTRELDGTVSLRLPDLTASLGSLKHELSEALVDLGLYPKEAEAMLETWGDSWFEEGLRVFYLMPKANVETVLPLALDPAPDETRRVFVGRIEVLSPHRRQDLQTALTNGDTATLARYGRFLEPFSERISIPLSISPATSAFLKSRADEARRQAATPSCVR
jgi:hypothetical protein